jgi:1,4-alpha-glucan branching enzyme
MIRMITISLGGEGYLNFMGNEFGHPEWVDFPRAGNKWSYQYARRQWTLVDTEHLRYHDLFEWDKAMIDLIKKHHVLGSGPANQIYLEPDKKIIAFERAELLFVFNFHVTESFFGFKLPVPQKGSYHIILHSDEKRFGGFERIEGSPTFNTDKKNQIQIYLPNRTCLVFAKR